jgi:DNA-binding response OmpR family regulator
MDTRILIVDDDTDIRDLMCKYLEMMGYKTFGALVPKILWNCSKKKRYMW